jgi:hypothetical protein
MAGRRVPAVRPDAQPLAGLGEERVAQRPPVAVTAVRRVDDQFGGRGLDGVGVLKLRVPDEQALRGQQQMPDPLPGTTAQLQPALLGHRLLSVGKGRLREEREHGLGLLGAQRGEDVEGAGGGVTCPGRAKPRPWGKPVRCRRWS